MSGISTGKIESQAGSVLLAALAILTILAVTITGILIFGGWQRTQGLFYLDEVRATSLAESGIHDAMAALADNPRLRYAERHIALDSTNKLSYSISPWGALLEVKSTGIGRRVSRTLTAIVGMRPPHIFDHVLVPIGSTYPLVVSGRTRIVGDVFVGPAGMTRGEINGRGYQGERLVEGRIDTLSLANMPAFESSLLSEFVDSLTELRTQADATDLSISYSQPFGPSNLDQSNVSAIRTLADIELSLSDSIPLTGPKYFFADRKILIGGSSQLRNMVFWAREVVVSQDARLKDCIIVADLVRLHDASVFGGQIIAEDTILVEEHAVLESSSVIILRGRKREERIDGLVEISSRAPIQATIVCGNRFPVSLDQFACRLRISEHSRLKALIWWEGIAEIDGAIEGAAAVHLFSHYVQPTTYMNWLVDADLRYSEATTAFPLVLTKLDRPKLCFLFEGVADD